MKLSSHTTVADYKRMLANKDKVAIADFISERFNERYITPINSAGKFKHGFCTMAVSCVMIEALESFWQGLPDTRNRSKAMFDAFFGRIPEFVEFKPYAVPFYYDVRCGILHQAETRHGWRIHRTGPLFDHATRTINATTFHRGVGRALRDYCKQLRITDWDEEIWVNFIRKMDDICAHSV